MSATKRSKMQIDCCFENSSLIVKCFQKKSLKVKTWNIFVFICYLYFFRFSIIIISIFFCLSFY